jgi:hypothetical protein
MYVLRLHSEKDMCLGQGVSIKDGRGAKNLFAERGNVVWQVGEV